MLWTPNLQTRNPRVAPLSEVKPRYQLTNVNFWGWSRFVDDELRFSGYRALLTADVPEQGKRFAYALVTDSEYAQAVLREELEWYLARLVRLAYRVLDGTDAE